jgi:hypothetical protein
MKTKLLFIGLFLTIIMNSCQSPAYLPKYSNIDENRFGSFINIHQKQGPSVQGELLAINGLQLIILTEHKNIKKSVVVPVSQINNFQLRYAQPRHYGWAIPLFTGVTVLHGWFAALTAPINLVGTIIVTVSGEDAFMYNQKQLSYTELKMFARFPQGIPPNIDIENIK